MQKYLILFLFQFSFIYLSGQCSINHSQEGCCVKMVVLDYPNHNNYQIEMGDGTILFRQDGDNDEFYYCYSGPGTYFVRMNWIDANGNNVGCGAGFLLTITEDDIENCEPELCQSYLCWEDFIGRFRCATSVTVAYPNGSVQTIPFINIPTGDDSWCTDPLDDGFPTFPIPSSIPVEGGYCEIAINLITVLENAGIDIEFSMTGSQQNCMKGNYPVPGFFIESSVQIVGINGDDCTGSNSDMSPFNSNCDYN